MLLIFVVRTVFGVLLLISKTIFNLNKPKPNTIDFLWFLYFIFQEYLTKIVNLWIKTCIMARFECKTSHTPYTKLHLYFAILRWPLTLHRVRRILCVLYVLLLSVLFARRRLTRYRSQTCSPTIHVTIRHLWLCSFRSSFRPRRWWWYRRLSTSPTKFLDAQSCRCVCAVPTAHKYLHKCVSCRSQSNFHIFAINYEQLIKRATLLHGEHGRRTKQEFLNCQSFSEHI